MIKLSTTLGHFLTCFQKQNKAKRDKTTNQPNEKAIYWSVRGVRDMVYDCRTDISKYRMPGDHIAIVSCKS